jgi:hypothetical protein
LSEHTEAPAGFDEGPFPNPPFALFFEAHERIARSIGKCKLADTVALVGGMLTVPEFQASSVRLEVLQHLVVASAAGKRTPRPCCLRLWLVTLGKGRAGMLEDPAEDVFVSRVSGADRDYLIFEGLYESSTFYLQMFLNLLEHMPAGEPYADLKRAASGLLALCDEVVRRSGVPAFTVGETEPLREIPRELVRQAAAIADRVAFSPSDLTRLGVPFDDIETFIFDLQGRHGLREETLGHSSLERSPLLLIEDRLYLALPGAVSIAIRRMVIEFCLSADMAAALYSAYVNELSRAFARVPMLGDAPAPIPPFQKQGGVFFASMCRWVDEGRLLHICFVVDSFDHYTETGTIGVNPDAGPVTTAIEASIAHTHKSFASDKQFREALSLIVICPWGRPFAAEFESAHDTRWRAEFVSAPDLISISWSSSFSPLKLWRLLDARDELERHGVQLVNINGLLNLYAWSKSLDGHLVPHGQLPDDAAGKQIMIYIEQNSLLEVRRKGAAAGDVHRARTWDGRLVRVRRFREDSIFEEDENVPLYTSLDDLDHQKLAAVYETGSRGWWVTIETPNTSDRNLHYRLWHALSAWLERAAPVLESSLSSLPEGPICWVCRFEDGHEFEYKDPVPTREQAKALLTVETLGNVVRVTARPGFLHSFRNPSNIGESLLVEAFVSGVSSLSRTEAKPDAVNALVARIVPDQWARDMHLFTARRFRDFVGHKAERKTILISDLDDARSRIGLGWRVRQRSEGARIEGIDTCCQYFNELVDSVWRDMRATLQNYDREAMLLTLLVNHEGIELESDRWDRTARAVLAMHRDKDAAALVATRQVARLNAGSLATRILIEMVLCECPTTGGRLPGTIDISRLLANVMQIHYFGGWSEAIRYGSMKPEIRITPLGDVHTHVDFDETIATPYGEALGINKFRSGAKTYESHFREVEAVESAQETIAAAFWEAWTEAFGFTIDDVRVFMDNVENEGIRRKELFFAASADDLFALDDPKRLEPQTVQRILAALSLKPRPGWDSTPEGFAAKDWYPWRFRRRLSLISKPILQTDEQPARYLVAPGIVRAGVAKILDYCYRGGYEAKDFPPGRMRSWIGAAENERGHAFNERVAGRLKVLGWETRSDIKLTAILRSRLDRDYGDVDVLAWRGGRVLAIECKDLEMAMTNSDIARQLHDFRGETGSGGKPDRLKKHLLRIELLRSRLADVGRFVGADGPTSVEAVLAFSELVPMHFAGVAAQHDVRLTKFDDLDTL